MNHVIILPVGSDGRTSPLDHLTRRWMCEACEEQARTVPQMAERLRRRGWRGETAGLHSTAKNLVSRGYLRVVGTRVHGQRQPSPIYEFVSTRQVELEAAIVANALQRIDEGSELLLVPAAALPVAAPVLRSAGDDVLWAVRTGESNVGLVVVVNGRSDIAARDALLHRLSPAGAQRLTMTTALDHAALHRYCNGLIEEARTALPPTA